MLRSNTITVVNRWKPVFQSASNTTLSSFALTSARTFRKPRILFRVRQVFWNSRETSTCSATASVAFFLTQIPIFFVIHWDTFGIDFVILDKWLLALYSPSVFPDYEKLSQRAIWPDNQIFYDKISARQKNQPTPYLAGYFYVFRCYLAMWSFRIFYRPVRTRAV